MTYWKRIIASAVLVLTGGACLLPGIATARMPRPVEHQLVIDLKPERGTLSAVDTLTFYPGKWERPSFVFLLNGDFEVAPVEIPHNGNWSISRKKITSGNRSFHRIEITKPPEIEWPDYLQLKFGYRGPYHDLQDTGEPSRGDGPHTLLLEESSYFYPVIASSPQKPLLIFEMQTVTSPGWEVVSEGKRITHISGEGRIANTWKCDDPVEEIHLITDQYHEFSGRWEDIDLMVFLRQDDPELARRYIEAAQRYIPFYQRLIGHYPFVKFAVVENSEQTGYGMPSFTLLGSQVIRFPFILHTSFPHEILHNWWGNGVYIDMESGNWAEGLTTYLADHLFPDLEGKGDQYRFQELMKYKNYVSAEGDFPLSEFTSRTDMVTQAIGYGKLVLVLHMLRNRIGDPAFLQGLHDFYFNNLFRRARYNDLQSYMEQASKQDLSTFFRQWVFTRGAPQLRLGAVEPTESGDRFELKFEVEQVQEGPVFDLALPVAIWMEGKEQPVLQTLQLSQARQSFSLEFAKKPRALLLDPRHEVFRRLNDGEIPPSISQTYGDATPQIVFSTTAEENRSRYEAFARLLQGDSTGVTNGEWKQGEHSVWVLGESLPDIPVMKDWLQEKGVEVNQSDLLINGRSFSRADHSVVLTVPHPHNPGRSLTWVILHSQKAVKGLARKLPHYGKYGYLVFEGEDPTNVEKGLWPANREGLLYQPVKGPLPLPRPTPLVNYRPGDPLE